MRILRGTTKVCADHEDGGKGAGVGAEWSSGLASHGVVDNLSRVGHIPAGRGAAPSASRSRSRLRGRTCERRGARRSRRDCMERGGGKPRGQPRNLQVLYALPIALRYQGSHDRHHVFRRWRVSVTSFDHFQ